MWPVNEGANEFLCYQRQNYLIAKALITYQDTKHNTNVELHSTVGHLDGGYIMFRLLKSTELEI